MNTQIEQKIDTCYAKIEKSLGVRIPRIPVEFSNRMTVTAGKFTYRGKEAIRIRYSAVIYRDNPEVFLGRTIGHEIAHHAVHHIHGDSVKPHGIEWKKMMHVIGQEASVKHNMKVNRKTFTYVVNGKSFELGAVRHKRCQLGATYGARGGYKLTAGDWVK